MSDAKRVLITGAGSGIGAETARRLRERGARVVGLDLEADEAADVLACDVSDPEAVVTAVAAAIERLGGGLDVLVNNAGVGTPQRAGQAPDAAAIAVLEVNAIGPWRVTAAALPALRASRGRVLNVASGLAHLTVPFATAYCMSKSALVAYSDALRYEHGHEITVTTIYPGYVRTPIHRASEAAGFGLEGVVPAEPVEAVADRMVAAALDAPARDVATTRQGTVSYAVLRRLPRRLVDRGVMFRIGRQLRSGRLDDSPLAGELARSLRRR